MSGNEALDPWGKILFANFSLPTPIGETLEQVLAPANGKDWKVHQLWIEHNDPAPLNLSAYMIDSSNKLTDETILLIAEVSQAQGVPMIWPNGVVPVTLDRISPKKGLYIPGDNSNGRIPGITVRGEGVALGFSIYGEYVYQERDRV